MCPDAWPIGTHWCWITGHGWRHFPSSRPNVHVDFFFVVGVRLSSAGSVASWALGDGVARTAAAGRMLTRRDMSFTAVMLASAWDA